MSDRRTNPDLDLLLQESLWVEELALSLVGDPAVAADLTQEALVAALRHSPDTRRDIRPWLSAVVRKLVLRWRRDRARKGATHAAGARAEALPSTDELVGQAELRRVVAEEAERLAEPYRTTVFLRYFKGLMPAEIARAQGLPPGTVRSRLKRALEQLRERMDERSGGDRGAWSAVALSLLPPEAGPIPVGPGVEPAISLVEGVLAMKAVLVVLGGLVVLTAIGAWRLGGGSSEAGPKEGLAGNPSATDLVDPAVAYDPDEPDGTVTRSTVAEPLSSDPSTGPAADAAVPPASVRGRVVDESGQGLSGATVLVLDHDARARSDASGGFVLDVAFDEGAERRITDVELSYPGLATRFERSALHAGESKNLGEIVLGPAGVVAGRVEDVAGRPLSDVRVFVSAPESGRRDADELRRHGPKLARPVLEARTDAAGSFRIEAVPAGFVRAWAHSNGRAYTSTDPIEVPREGSVEGLVIVLPGLTDADAIEGVVLSPGGDPVPGATLVYAFEFAETSSEVTGLVTDGDGRFFHLVKHRVPHTFQVTDPEARWADVVRVDVEPGEPELAFRFEDTPDLEVVARAPDGSPVDEYAVAFRPTRTTAGPLSVRDLARLRRGPREEGRARLPVPTERYRVEVDAEGYELAVEGPFDAGSSVGELLFRLEALPAVSGRVVSANGPVPGAEVRLRTPVGADTVYTVNGYRSVLRGRGRGAGEARTDADGRFDLPLRDGGEYVLCAQKEGFATSELALDVDARAGATGVEVLLGHGGAIEGRVIVAAGTDPAGVIVALNHGDGNPRTVRVGADGTYRFEGLTTGMWQVIAVDEELDPRTSSTTMTSTSNPPPIEWSCEVFEGETTTFDLDLRHDEPARLVGRLDLGGMDLTGWSASLSRVRDGLVSAEDAEISTGLAGDGSFVLEAPAPAEVQLVLQGPAERFGGLQILEGPIELVPGDNPWAFDVAVASVSGDGAPTPVNQEVVLEYRWSSGERDDGRSLEGKVRIAPDASGRFRLPVVPAGGGQIGRWVHPPGDESWSQWETVATLSVEAGQVATVTLD